MFLRHHLPAEAIHRITVFRIDTLALGGLVAVLVAYGIRFSRFRRPTLFGIAGVGIGICWIPAHSKLMLTAGFTGVAIASGCLVFYAATNSGSAGLFCRVLRSHWLQRLGKYSYGIYILHLPIVRWLAAERETVFTHLHLHRGTLTYEGIVWLTIAIDCVASYAAALLSWHLLEKHFLRLKDRFKCEPGEVPQEKTALYNPLLIQAEPVGVQTE
jgi:peptidoglycan/LPS O-acetylase OafA/YrhL